LGGSTCLLLRLEAWANTIVDGDLTVEDEGGVGADGDAREDIFESPPENRARQHSMTDALKGKEDAQRILAYAESIAKESRKALTIEFNQKHKGIPFNSVPKVLQESLLAWFARRDKNVKVTLGPVNTKSGEVRATFGGEAKSVRFEIHADAMFKTASEAAEAPCYLKELNVTIGKSR